MRRKLLISAIPLCLFLWAALPSVAMAVDQDGDGHHSIISGGDDCDDNDANRYPGNAEVCSGELNHDEDCNEDTFGDERDTDGDGFVADYCCNVKQSGGLNCGTDCDDGLRAVNPNGTEVCNGRDDNCDGGIDWSPESGYVNVLAYIDNDRDGWGDNNDNGIKMCPKDLFDDLRTGVKGDCDDKSASINPGATEACNGLDDNCNGVGDEGLTGACD